MPNDYSPYGSDYYLDESGRKDAARFALEQLYEATGVPAFKRYKQAIKEEYTPGRKSALHLAEAMAGVTGLGSISPQSLNMTKKEMLKALGKSFGSELRYLKTHLAARPEASKALSEAAREYKGRTKSLANEIRSSGEIFHPVKEFNPASYESQWIPETDTLMLNSEEASPRQLRHELHHGYRDMYVPGNLNRYIRDYQRADTTAYNVAMSHEKAFDAMSRKFGDMFRSKTEDISTAHGYHPEEIAAIKAEDIPLSTYKSSGDYLDKLYDLYKSALKERSAKESSIYRYKRLYKD